MTTLASAQATEATALGLLLAQVDAISDAVKLGAHVDIADLRLLLKRRDEHQAATDALFEAEEAERNAVAARASERIDLALRKSRGELEEA